ncbi:hypothetical protein B6U93_00820 [Candidatus Woesearchaeota archaeon ex4484_78]|nr:MAG: hypothetical protein B6U93_00820 [Candidatus Woesearchaeota archaeon ex4484_78]
MNILKKIFNTGKKDEETKQKIKAQTAIINAIEQLGLRNYETALGEIVKAIEATNSIKIILQKKARKNPILKTGRREELIR